jgi:hypothetical protein
VGVRRDGPRPAGNFKLARRQTRGARVIRNPRPRYELLGLLQHISVSAGSFWAKLSVGGILTGISLPSSLGSVKWLRWLCFGAGLECFAWAFFERPSLYVALGLVGAVTFVAIVLEYRHRSAKPPAPDDRPRRVAHITRGQGQTFASGNRYGRGLDAGSVTEDQGRTTIHDSEFE